MATISNKVKEKQEEEEEEGGGSGQHLWKVTLQISDWTQKLQSGSYTVNTSADTPPLWIKTRRFSPITDSNEEPAAIFFFSSVCLNHCPSLAEPNTWEWNDHQFSLLPNGKTMDLMEDRSICYTADFKRHRGFVCATTSCIWSPISQPSHILIFLLYFWQNG